MRAGRKRPNAVSAFNCLPCCVLFQGQLQYTEQPHCLQKNSQRPASNTVCDGGQGAGRGAGRNALGANARGRSGANQDETQPIWELSTTEGAVQGTVQGVPHSAHVIVAIRELLPSGLVSLELRLLTKQGAALRAAQDVTRLSRIVAVHPNAADSFIESHVTSKHSAVKAEAAATCSAGRGAGRGAGRHPLGARLHRHPGAQGADRLCAGLLASGIRCAAPPLVPGELLGQYALRSNCEMLSMTTLIKY